MVWRPLSSDIIFFSFDKCGWPNQSCNSLGLGDATQDTWGLDSRWYKPSVLYPFPIHFPEPLSCITKNLLSKVIKQFNVLVKIIEQFNVLVNWLNQIKLKRQLGTKLTYLRFREGESETWLIPFEEVLEPFANVMKWWFPWKERDENKEALLEMWLEAPESITY